MEKIYFLFPPFWFYLSVLFWSESEKRRTKLIEKKKQTTILGVKYCTESIKFLEMSRYKENLYRQVSFLILPW